MSGVFKTTKWDLSKYLEKIYEYDFAIRSGLVHQSSFRNMKI